MMTRQLRARSHWLVAFALLANACAKSQTAASESASATAAFTAAAPRVEARAAHERVGVLAPGTGIPVGQSVPDVRGVDLNGRATALASIYEKSPVLLVFYREGWCPYCNREIHALSMAYPEFQKRGVTPVAMSVDMPEADSLSQATYTIPFPVLSDTSAESLLSFHVVNPADAAQIEHAKSPRVNVEQNSAQSHHEIAIPALFLIDRTGVVRWAHSDPEYKVRPSTAELLAAIDELHLS